MILLTNKIKWGLSSFILVFLCFSSIPIFSKNLNTTQEQAKLINQKVFNQIEYFISMKQTDSIYNLTSPLFRQNVDRNTFKQIINMQVYPMGSIKNAKMVEFLSSSSLAKYRVDFENLTLQFDMSIDQNNQIDYFLIKPFSLTKEEELPVIQSVPKGQRVEAFINEVGKRQVKKHANYQLAITVINQGQVKNYFFGNSVTPTLETVFEIGSLTKTFTSTLLAYYAGQGMLNIDDPIANYLPDSLKNITAIQSITFKNLANHTSGLPRLPGNLQSAPEFNMNNPYATYSKEMLWDYLKSLGGLETSEYPQFEYSNLGYGLLGTVLEHITQKSYEQMIQEVFVENLGLKNTFVSTQAIEKNWALPHNEAGRTLTPWVFQALEATGGIRSSIEDLTNYVKGHLRTPNSDLDEAMLQTRQFTYFYPPETDLGLSWFIQLKNDQIMYFHDGQTAGSSSFIGMNPDTKTAVIILSNGNESVVNLVNQIWEYIFQP